MGSIHKFVQLADIVQDMDMDLHKDIRMDMDMDMDMDRDRDRDRTCLSKKNKVIMVTLTLVRGPVFKKHVLIRASMSAVASLAFFLFLGVLFHLAQD